MFGCDLVATLKSHLNRVNCSSESSWAMVFGNGLTKSKSCSRKWNLVIPWFSSQERDTQNGGAKVLSVWKEGPPNHWQTTHGLATSSTIGSSPLRAFSLSQSHDTYLWNPSHKGAFRILQLLDVSWTYPEIAVSDACLRIKKTPSEKYANILALFLARSCAACISSHMAARLQNPNINFPFTNTAGLKKTHVILYLYI